MSEDNGRPAGELEFRGKDYGVQVTGVSFPERTVDVIVMPYEQETLVEHDGRMVYEVVTRGAFDGIQRRKIKANRDHDITKVVGHCVGLHPRHQDGLVAEVKIADTLLGDETLTLAKDGLLDMSAGFMPMPDGQQWETRGRDMPRRRITKAWLGHIAFVPEPAYEGARVLAVRQAAESRAEASAVVTPNLDTIRGWRLQAEFDRSERYSSPQH